MKNSATFLRLIAYIALLTIGGCKKNNPVLSPVINTITPASGTSGTSVTINGAHFSATATDNTVKFNGTAATVTSATTNTLVVSAPAGGSTGSVSVSTTAGTATGPVFTYLPGPMVTAINPTTGLAGATVTITGTGFDIIATNDVVKFNGTVTTVTAATATSLTVTAPAGGSTGAVTVATNIGITTGPVFTYLQPPVITAITPASAAAGTAVTITGTNFDATAANDAVKFNGTAASITSATATQIVVTAPAGGSTGGVTVTTAGGTSNAFTFTYLATGPSIYVLGSDTRYGLGYWKNSVFTATTDCNSAYAMAGVGNDIYVAGPSTANTPTYWKNNTPVHLSAQTGFVTSIAVSGTDVYCLGYVNGTYYVWKNGTPTPLTTTTNDIGQTFDGYYLNNTLAVSNGDTYVAGSQYLGGSTISKATYWKNGTPVELTDGIHSGVGGAWATAVYVSGSDVYVAGIEQIRDPSSGGIINDAPRVWKNGVSIALTTPVNSLYTSVSCILVTGSDVYVGGQYNGGGALWKNGTMVNPAAYAVAEHVSSIFLYNNTDLYVTGASSSSGENGYWKNGNFVEMDPGCNVVSSSCAATAANQVISIYVK